MAASSRRAPRIPISAKERATEESLARLRSLMLLIGALFLILLARFWYLQIAQGAYYQQQAERNRTAAIEMPAPRGLIRDRTGAILASTRQAYTISVLPAEVVDLDALLERLSQILGRPREELKEDYHKNRIGRFRPVPIARDVPMDVVTILEEEQTYLPGVLVEPDPVRVYPRGAFASHLIGYVREISPDELKGLRDKGYRSRDIVGKIGVEKFADEYLRGRLGRQEVERDAHGNLLQILGTVPPVPGNTANLTLDARVQSAAENGLFGKVGAAVAIDPRNGDVLAMASSPTFDPTWYTRRLSPEEYRQTIGTPQHPMINRAISSAQPPGSTFKIISATALLERKIITTRSGVYCTGGLQIGNKRKRCWSRHNSVNIYTALAKSCDVFFYQYGMALTRRSPEPISEWAERFGLSQRTGIPIPGEVKGKLPHDNPKRPWYPGHTANMIIGQGDTLATPLQVAQMIGVIANGGTRYQPRVVRNVVGPDGKQVKEFPVEVAGRVQIRPEVLKIVRDGLRQTVAAGTGKIANLEKIAVAGKTGSAEHHRDKKAHAWFCCYAPFENPTIAIAVLVEEGGHGSTTSGPIARRMLEAHFGIQSDAPLPVVHGD